MFVRIADGNDAEEAEEEEHPCAEEGEAEHGHAPAALTNLKAFRCNELERAVHASRAEA